MNHGNNNELKETSSNLGHFQYAVIKSKQSHTFNVIIRMASRAGTTALQI